LIVGGDATDDRYIIDPSVQHEYFAHREAATVLPFFSTRSLPIPNWPLPRRACLDSGQSVPAAVRAVREQVIAQRDFE
jgi:hypothetical protein